ncbi:trypsin-like serine protease [Sorangium sp. So ce834]|uniref:trypsin-like serine peptidase n=1 Tax=Sorangium sp. So ce834 TaxID=3133321 RepID=UPI003F5E48EF
MNHKEAVDVADPLYTGICALDITPREGSAAYRGTGFLIHPRIVATAAHNIYNDRLYHGGEGERRFYAYSIRVRFAVARGPSRESSVGVDVGIDRFRVCDDWRARAVTKNDYGAILLPCNVIDPSVKTFRLSRGASLAESVPARTCLAGYPTVVTRPTEMSGDGRMYREERCVALGMNDVVEYPFDTDEGQSGSPIWREIDGEPVAMAIHSQRGRGRRITAEVASVFGSWIKEVDPWWG